MTTEKKLFYTALSVGLLLTHACTGPKLNTQDPPDDTKPSDNFTFSTARDIQLNVRIAAAWPNERHRINVYNDVPSGDNLIIAGMAKANDVLQLAFRIPAPQQYLYVEKVDPYGNRQLSKVLAKEYESVDFQTPAPILSLRTAAITSGIDCTQGATKVYNNYTGSITVSSGETVSLTGSYSGDLTIRGGVVRVCGKASISNISLNKDGSQLYFLENATATLTNLNLNASKAQVFNYASSLTITGTASFGGSFDNFGKLTINGDLNINNGSFVNNGELTVANNLSNNRSLTNNGSLLVKGSLQVNGNATTVNTCKLVVNTDLTLNNDVTNSGYIRSDNQLRINGGGTLTMKDGAQLSTRDAMVNGTINGTGTKKSTVKVSGNSTLNGGSLLRGNLNYCDANGVEVNTSKTPATLFSCNNTIPTSACNPEGFSRPVILDADKDGVSDVQDEYPNDAARAFNTYYPSAGGWGTYAFEDMWPKLGDYDFNDLVINYRTTRVLNADNRIVDLHMDATVEAVGAGYTNGFGFQLNGIGSDEVANVTGSTLSRGLIRLNANKTEADQPNAVIIGFDSPEPLIRRAGGQFFNTVKEEPRGTSVPWKVTISFKTPLAQNRLAQSVINPFVFIGGERGRELHLLNYAPTAKATQALLGSADDKSSAGLGQYYLGDNNLPWALDIAHRFEYPAEGAPIPTAYLFFNPWASSRGQKNADWFYNKSGNTNPKKVY